MRFFSLIAAATLMAACVSSPGAGPQADAPTPAQAATAFLEAFNALDAERFDSFFADDATMFFPDGPFPQQRVEGKAAVTAAFHQFFDLARERGATRLGIRPQDLTAQEHGAFAVVTFHLRGNGNIGRRSLVFRREPNGWRIVHFHASSLEARPEEAAGADADPLSRASPARSSP